MRTSDTGIQHFEFRIPHSEMSPYLRAGYGHGEAVPEAAVDEDGDLSAGVGDIWAACGQWSVVGGQWSAD